MKDVCDMGKNVISWLSDEADDGHRACQQRRTLATARDATTAQELRVRWQETPAQLHDGCLLEMHELIRHPYWCELWVVQELVIGNRAVTVRCGDEQMDWQTFIGGIKPVTSLRSRVT